MTVAADDPLASANRLRATLIGLDDRGLILTLSAFFEQSLGNLLRAYFFQGEASKQLLEGFNAPLGTLSARIKAVGALGLVDASQYADLERMRRVRNLFAHTWEPLTFEIDRVRQHIVAMNFSLLSDEYPETLARKVELTLGDLVVEIEIAALVTARRRDRQPLGSRLLAGVGTEPAEAQLEKCSEQLEFLRSELFEAKGERRRFLLNRVKAWEAKTDMLWMQSPDGPIKAQVELVRDHYVALARNTGATW